MSHKFWAESCSAAFHKRDEPRTHAAQHGFVRVWCPWCPSSDKSHRRSVDLNARIKKTHQGVYTTDLYQHLAERRAQILAVNAKDYRRVVGQADEDQTAKELRSLMRRWAEKSGISVQELEEGWAVERYSPTKPLLNHQLVRLDVGAEGVVAVIWTANTKYRKVTAAPTVMTDGRKKEAIVRRLTTLQPDLTLPPLPCTWAPLSRLDDGYMWQVAKVMGADREDVLKVEVPCPPKVSPIKRPPPPISPLPQSPKVRILKRCSPSPPRIVTIVERMEMSSPTYFRVIILE